MCVVGFLVDFAFLLYFFFPEIRNAEEALKQRDGWQLQRHFNILL
jgi:hypothetical protein